MMMSPAYVEDGSFNVVRDEDIGGMGTRLRHRVYQLKQNPDQRPGSDISHSVVMRWLLCGCPSDVVFHLGRFHRLTVM